MEPNTISMTAIDSQLEAILPPIYGANAIEQIVRYRKALLTFRDRFGATGQVHIVRAPGRVNLIGEHTDYNHGYVMPAALDKDVVILAQPRSDDMIHLHNSERLFAPITFPIASQVPPAPRGDWGNYARGVVQVFTQFMGSSPPGMDLLIVSASPHGVPRGAGLSSSTAFTVALGLTLCHLAGWSIEPEQLIQLCSDSEWYVGTRGGIMDQFAALFGRKGHALFLDCRPGSNGHYRYQPLPLPQTYRLLVVDSGIHHENTHGEFNQRVAACRAGVALLRRDHPTITHLRDVQAIPWDLLEPLLPERISVGDLVKANIDLGELPGLTPSTQLHVRARCRHIWSENQRVVHAVDALESNNIEALGDLLDEAHRSARDDYAISCPELEVLIKSAHEVDGVYGTRLTGAGWGGCIIALVHEDAVQHFQQHIQQRYQEATGQIAAIFPCQVGTGAAPLSPLSLGR